jgi:membrane-associated protease RseP (regulator of RpoE activity)
MIRRTATLALLLLGGCASVNFTAPPGAPPTPPTGRYEVESGRDAAMVAELRAAPPPANPEIVAGKNRIGDRRQLAARGFVHIGSAYFPGADSHARDDAMRQGQAVGADRILLYAPAANTDATTGSEWVATYYVHFQLPFGATYRDLRSTERSTLGRSGVAIGAVIGGTPASRANLLAGDFVIGFDGKPVADRTQFTNLLKRNAGHRVTLTLVRNGVTLKRPIRLGLVASTGDH